MPAYFGDVRDKFDELYRAAATFVRLPSSKLASGTHVRFHVDLETPIGAEQFRELCYAYEDSFDWEKLPLLFDPEIPTGFVRWQQAATVVSERSIRDALASFESLCCAFMQSCEG